MKVFSKFCAIIRVLLVACLWFFTLAQALASNTLTVASKGESGSSAVAQSEAANSELVEISGLLLTGISVILAIVVFFAGVITTAGGALIWSAFKERENLKRHMGDLNAARDSCLEELSKERAKALEMIERLAVSVVSVRSSKQRLDELLTFESNVNLVEEIYTELQRTVAYPDRECIGIYYRILEKYESSVDLVRLVRNGLHAYARQA